VKSTLKFFSVLLIFAISFTSVTFAEKYDTYLDDVKFLIESVLREEDYNMVYGNESGFVIYTATDGLLGGAIAVMNGTIDYSEWESYINATIDYANSIAHFIELVGIENPNLLFIVVDEYSHEMPLLAICNGKVVYNIVYTI